MIIFPPNITPTKFEGYYWDLDRGMLYSIKVGGKLRKLRLGTNAFYPKVQRGEIPRMQGYQVSVKGKSRFLSLEYLNNLTLTDIVLELPTN